MLAWQEHHLQGRDLPVADLCRDCPELIEALSQRLARLRPAQALVQPGSRSATATPADPTRKGGQTGVSDTAKTIPGPGPIQSFFPVRENLVPGYEILGELGRGGMGVVYKARQLSLNRLVALKMILAGVHAGPEALARFLREAETIALLQHPHIVQVHDYGTHEGMPYFSLEYLDGGSLQGQLDGEPQPPRQAAQTVEVLARAIEAAHALGIIHRDLKPANVLRAADGSLKITDFGLAKQSGSGITVSGEMLGTPSYMAPEQAQGRAHAVGPAADIYALGTILYELVTGRPPFKGASAWDTVQQVLEKDPIAPTQLRPRLPRDLETICLKCMQKEPARRYTTARALAEDLGRFLRDEPIEARRAGDQGLAPAPAPTPFQYAGLLVGLALALAAGFVGVTVAWLQAEHHRHEAVANLEEANRQRDEAVKGFRQARAAVDHFFTLVGQQTLLQKPGMYPLRKQLLQQARDFYQTFVREHGEDPSLRAELAGALHRLADITEDVGSNAEALQAYQEAAAAYKALAPTDADPLEVRYSLSKIWGHVGLLYVGNGQRAQAQAAFREEVRCLEELLAQRPGEAEYKEGLGVAYNHLGLAYRRAGRLADSEAVLRRGAALWEELLAVEKDNAGYQEFFGWCQVHLGLVYDLMNQEKQARAAFERMMALRRGLVEHFPDNPEYKQELAEGYSILADFYEKRDPPGAEASARQSIAIGEQLVQDNPRTATFLKTLVRNYRSLGTLLSGQQKSAAALDCYDRALRALKQALADTPSDRTAQVLLPGVYSWRADVLDDLGRYQEALTDWDQAVALDKSSDRNGYRASRALTLIHAGQQGRALAEADALTAAKEVRPDVLYSAACVYALAAGAAKPAHQADSYAAKAVELLERARTRGYFGDADNRQTLQSDKDLAALRSRADFQKLLMAVGK
jgi:serine/threonine-protein kinase